MSANPGAAAEGIDWNKIDLVVFDVDGTLYDQRRLRLTMLRELARHAWTTRSLETIRILRTFRQVRESLGERPGADFLELQYLETAARHRCAADAVRALATEWMEARPLPWLAACRYPHLDRLFAALRARGKRIAVFSDYPAQAKLAALQLQAEPVVCATDPGIARLKPDPLGLRVILEQTGAAAGRTLMIGDRFDRDAAAARAAGMATLIRSARPHPQVPTFRHYDDPLFQPLLAPARGAAAP